MKRILIAVVTVGAAIAGLVFYYDKKIERQRLLSEGPKDNLAAVPEDVAPPLAIQAIP